MIPYIGQSSPSGNEVWNGANWVVAPQVNAGYGLGVDRPGGSNQSANEQIKGSYNPAQYTPSDTRFAPGGSNPASPNYVPPLGQGPKASGTPVLTQPLPAGAGGTSGGMTGQQVLDAIQQRIASGQPIDQAWAISLWKQAGLNDQQAASMHQIGANFQNRNGRPLNAQEIDGFLGQFRQGLSPSLDAGSIGPASGPTQSSNGFLNGLSLADLADTVRRDKGDMSNVAQVMIGNREGTGGARFNSANRDMMAQAADDMKGLFALDSIRDPSVIDTASRLGDYYNQRTAGGTTQYDTNQIGRLRGALDSLNNGSTNATTQAFLSDPTAQTLAARTGLQRSVNPLLATAVGQRVNEEAAKYNTVNASRPPDKGGFLQFLKNGGFI